MIRQLEKVIEEVKPGAVRKPSHLRIVAKAARAIWNIEAGTGIKITKGRKTIRIDLE